MNSNTKIKRPKKTGVLSVVFLGLFSFLAMIITVAFVASGFFIYSFNELYTLSAEAAEDLSKNINTHIYEKQERAYECGRLVTEYLSSGNLARNEETLNALNYILRTAAGGDDEGLSDCVFFDEDNEDIKDTEYYKNAKGGIFGTSCYDGESGRFLVYTAPITIEGYTKGFVCISENGRMLSLYHKFAEENKTGISMTYIMTEKNETVAYAGNALPNYVYFDGAKVDTRGSDLPYEIYVESISEAFSPIANAFVLPGNVYINKLHGSFTLPNAGEVLSGEKSFLIANLWFKQPVKNLDLYTWTQAKIYLEDRLLLNIILLAVTTLILMLIPLTLMLVSISSRIKSQRALVKVAHTDELTGYGNWLFFEDNAARLLYKNRSAQYALVSIEMNKFRLLADYYGAGFTKSALEKVSEVISRLLGKNEVFARYEESQFSLLLLYASEERLLKRTLEIMNALTKNLQDGKISFRAGIYPIQNKNLDISAINLYAVNTKDTLTPGAENEAAMFDNMQRERSLKEKRFEDLMEKAIEKHEFVVYMQPKYCPESNKLSGAEALIRWQSEELGFISPGEFIPVFEKNGFISKLDDYMLHEVASTQARWISEARDCVPVSVNISRIHFTNPNLALHICEIIDSFNVPHDLIELELTESAFFDDQELLLGTVAQLRNLGFLVSMDDFGSGYSSLNSLKDIPLDIIKLDGGFFGRSHNTARGEKVVKGTIRLAKELNMKIVAEGIETLEQVEFLQRHGCDYIQGYYYAKPMPITDFEKLNGSNDKSVAEDESVTESKSVAKSESIAEDESVTEKESIAENESTVEKESDVNPGPDAKS